MRNSTVQNERNTALQDAGSPVIGGKTCSKCKKIKPVDCFSKNKNYPFGLSYGCKKCRSIERSGDSSLYKYDVPEGMAYCRICEQLKPLNEDNFHKSKITGKSRLINCKKCRNKANIQYAIDNKSKVYKRQEEWRKNNHDKVKACRARTKLKNRDSIREKDKEYRSRKDVRKARRKYEREYYHKNREKMIAISCAYDSRVRKARPKWQCQKEINNYYKKAKMLGMEVDHIVPITSNVVCGLHCLDNFQMLTRSENARKSNKYWPDMPEVNDV